MKSNLNKVHILVSLYKTNKNPPSKNKFSKDLPFKNGSEFIKQNLSKYKGNFEFFRFPFFGMKITFLITLGCITEVLAFL